MAAKRLHIEDLEFLLDMHPWATTQWLADRLDADKSTVRQALDRAGRADLLAQLARNARVAA